MEPNLTQAQYRARVEEVFAAIERQIDRWADDDVIDIDARRSGFLLELIFPGGSQIVINAQAPLQELWLAARSGGWHYRCDGTRWIDTRAGSEFFTDLSRCATEQVQGTMGRALYFKASGPDG